MHPRPPLRLNTLPHSRSSDLTSRLKAFRQDVTLLYEDESLLPERIPCWASKYSSGKGRVHTRTLHAFTRSNPPDFQGTMCDYKGCPDQGSSVITKHTNLALSSESIVNVLDFMPRRLRGMVGPLCDNLQRNRDEEGKHTYATKPFHVPDAVNLVATLEDIDRPSQTEERRHRVMQGRLSRLRKLRNSGSSFERRRLLNVELL